MCAASQSSTIVTFPCDVCAQEAAAGNLSELLRALLHRHHLRHYARSILHIRVQVLPSLPASSAPSLTHHNRCLRGLRAATFIGSGMSGLVPVVHMVNIGLDGNWISAQYISLMGFL